MATLVVRSSDGGGGGGQRGRSRKSKNAAKKQPQRGLGVAQLEKLRLQEQSKQEAASLASLGMILPLGSTSPTPASTTTDLPHWLARNLNVVKPGTVGNPCPHSLADPVALLVRRHQQQLELELFRSKIALSKHLHHQQHQQQRQEQQEQHVNAPPHQDFFHDGPQFFKHQALRSYDGRGPTNLFDSSHPPGVSTPVKRELSLLGVSIVPTELSSFQTKYTVWPTLQNVPASPDRRHCNHPPRSVDSHSSTQSRTSPSSLEVSQHTATPTSSVVAKSPLPFLAFEPDSSHTKGCSGRGELDRLSMSQAATGGSSCSKKRSTCSSSHVEKPRKSSKMTMDDDPLSLRLWIPHVAAAAAAAAASTSASSASAPAAAAAAAAAATGEVMESECSGDSHYLQKSQSMQETITELEDSNPTSPSYGSSTMDFPPTKCTATDIRLSLKL